MSRIYDANASEAAFLLGGIGTGNVSVGARGELRDWEMFNSPNKGFRIPTSFFAIRIHQEGRDPVSRVLEARRRPPFSGPHGLRAGADSLARFADSRMCGEYPFVQVDLIDDSLPVTVRMEAFTPFIPLNANDSGIPAAIIRYTVTNGSEAPVEVSVAGILANMSGFTGLNELERREFADTLSQERRTEDGFSGVFMRPTSLSDDHRAYGNMGIIAVGGGSEAFTAVSPSASFGNLQDFWDEFRTTGCRNVGTTPDCRCTDEPSKSGLGMAGDSETLQPGGSREFEFVISWYFPNRPRRWQIGKGSSEGCCESVRNYYATLFTDAWDVGRYIITNRDRLEKGSRDFHRALYTSTLPPAVIDAAGANITVLRSPTCFRLDDGTFAGWEGCRDDSGCCPGSCTHVWNYAQTVAFLFPELEQSMRMVEFNLETDVDGNMAFRTQTIFDIPRWDFYPAADGQLGTIIRLYRDWKLSGDDSLLKSVWNKARAALDFAFTYWDSDGDFVLDSRQHNTYDIEFYGPNSLSNSMFYAALAAGREMAAHLGDEGTAKRYGEALEAGSRRMDEMLWDGEFYVQRLDDINQHKHQYGAGCLSDQILGQLLAHVAGIGYVLPREHVRTTVESIYKYNFQSDFMEKHNATGRTYALNDEQGLVLCTWPRGGRPRRPFYYCDEVWTGVEYQVAAHLIYEGFVEEGFSLVQAVRDRYDGVKRNPWNEVECGHHYVRSMASWAVLLAASGFSYDLVGPNPTIGFDPRINTDDFSSFFSTGRCWGIYRQKLNAEGDLEWDVEVLHGALGDIEVRGPKHWER